MSILPVTKFVVELALGVVTLRWAVNFMVIVQFVGGLSVLGWSVCGGLSPQWQSDVGR